MEKVILYSQTVDPKLVIEGLARLDVKLAATRAELAEAIVHEPDILCVIIQVDELDSDLESFLISLRRCMQRLNVAVVCRHCAQALPEVYTHVELDAPQETLVRDLQNFAFSAAITNRRRANRFDWPLQGYLSLEPAQWREYRVRSLGCGGAFLECEGAVPEPGARGQLRIVFQDFKMLTDCEVLDARRASSKLPAGFGVRFVGFSEASCSVIDRIVDDALIHSLLDPADEPGAPSLGDDDMLTMGPELT